MVFASKTTRYVSLLSSVLILAFVASGQKIADLSQPWQESALYNRNSAHCAMQSQLRYPMLGYVIIKDGMIYAEGYRDGVLPTDLFPTWSGTKTWTSLLIGHMVDRGVLQLDWTLGQIFPMDTMWEGVTNAEEKRTIRVKELLTMTSGLSDIGEVLNALLGVGQETLVDVLNAVDYDATSRGEYNYLLVSHILSRIIFRIMGKTPGQLAVDAGIFEAMGVTEDDYEWETFGGVEGSAYGFSTNVRTLAKLGVLYLQKGMAGEDVPVLNSTWISESTVNHLPGGVPLTSNPLFLGYGYLWWTDLMNRERDGIFRDMLPDMEGAYAALGRSGQVSAVFPKYNMVVAIMCNESEDTNLLYALFALMTALRNVVRLDDVDETCGDGFFDLFETAWTAMYGTFVLMYTQLERFF